MKKLIALGALAMLSACGAPPTAVVQPAAADPAALPADVIAALPRGVPPEAVQKDGNGCYSYVNAIEIVVLRQGGTDGGAPICDPA